MAASDIKKASQSELKSAIASRSNDPFFYAGLIYLPNPDTVLQKLGRAQEVYDAIMLDSHVLGELRSVRSGMLGYEWRLVPGGDSSADIASFELCQKVMNTQPDANMQWADVIWNIAQAVFRGYRVHEVVWKREGNYLVPGRIVDRPNRRFVFNNDNDLRLITRDHMLGEAIPDHKFLLTRHMPSFDNPYGIAIFSSCFWPYTFKHNGFRYFVKFCEKYGIPWALGKYPEGTPTETQQELADRLAEMVEDGVAAIPNAGSVELLSITTRGEMAQERLIQACNKEMSKALTSQTLATEIQGDGSRAASETHRGREQDVNTSDRVSICHTFNQLFAWITEFNFKGALPPTFEFYEESEPRKDWVDVLNSARGFMDVPASFAYDRLQIPEPQDGEATLPRAMPGPAMPGQNFNQHTCPNCGGSHDFATQQPDNIDALTKQAADHADELISSLAEPIAKALKESSTMIEFREKLDNLYPEMDDKKLGELTTLAMMTGMLEGMDGVS